MKRYEETSAAGVTTVDDVLRGYFQREMPNPWPACQATAPTLAAEPRRSRPRLRLLGSRYFALAASLVLLVMGMCTATEMVRPAENEAVPAFHGVQPSAGHRDRNGNLMRPQPPKNNRMPSPPK